MNKWMAVIVLVVVVIGLSICALSGATMSDHAAEVAQAQGVIEANRTAQIATAQQAATNVWLMVVATVEGLGIIVLIGAVVRLLTKKRTAQEEEIPGKWVSGPNARWKRVEIGRESGGERLPAGVQMEALIQLETLKALREMRGEKRVDTIDPYKSLPDVNDDMEIRW